MRSFPTHQGEWWRDWQFGGNSRFCPVDTTPRCWYLICQLEVKQQATRRSGYSWHRCWPTKATMGCWNQVERPICSEPRRTWITSMVHAQERIDRCHCHQWNSDSYKENATSNSSLYASCLLCLHCRIKYSKKHTHDLRVIILLPNKHEISCLFGKRYIFYWRPIAYT